MNAPIDWLLEGEPYIAFRTRRDLLSETEQEPSVVSARSQMVASLPVAKLMVDFSGWSTTVVSSHKSAGQLFHKLTFLADLGLKADDLGMDRVVAAVMAHQEKDGPFQVLMNIPTHFGGTGQDQWAWALCDAPLNVYGLAKLGLHDHPAVRAAAGRMSSLARDNGFPCAVSTEMGKWRGPGRKDDPCPFANLAMLKAFTAFDDLRDSPATRTGAETLLTLWCDSAEQHPYMFFMGTDFRKIKAPLIWYDLIHVLDVLSQFPWLRNDPRLLDMLNVLMGKADAQGRFTPESVWTAWKDWEFGQKKVPSRWLTLLAWRIIGRIENP